MSNRYQREIEEILRSMEETEPQPAERRKNTNGSEPRQRVPRGPSRLAPGSLAGIFLLLGVGLLLLASGFAWYQNGANWLSGVIGVLALASMLTGLTMGWVRTFRPVPPPMWRGNIVEMHPNRGARRITGFLGRLRLWRLRRHYRRDIEP
jgi:hypothetical protein